MCNKLHFVKFQLHINTYSTKHTCSEQPANPNATKKYLSQNTQVPTSENWKFCYSCLTLLQPNLQTIRTAASFEFKQQFRFLPMPCLRSAHSALYAKSDCRRPSHEQLPLLKLLLKQHFCNACRSEPIPIWGEIRNTNLLSCYFICISTSSGLSAPLETCESGHWLYFITKQIKNILKDLLKNLFSFFKYFGFRRWKNLSNLLLTMNGHFQKQALHFHNKAWDSSNMSRSKEPSWAGMWCAELTNSWVSFWVLPHLR